MTTDSAISRPSEPPAPNRSAQVAPITRSLGWLAAVRIHERDRNEKCVLGIGVWGIETEQEAEAAFWELLGRAIRT